MKPSLRISSILVGFVLGGMSAFGDEPVSDPNRLARLTAEQSAWDTAKELSKTSGVVAAEQALLTLNRTQPATVAWHLDIARRLLQLADGLRRENRSDLGASITQRILLHLQEAESLTRSNADRYAVKAFAGMVYERQLNDPVNALREYEAAAALVPNSASASERVSKLRQKLTPQADVKPRN